MKEVKLNLTAFNLKPENTLWFIKLGMVIISGINFSLLFSVNKWAGNSNVPFGAYVFWYALGAAIILSLVAIFRKERFSIGWNYIRTHSVSAFLGFAFPFAIFAFVAAKLPSGIAILFVILTPVFTYVWSLLFKLEPFRLGSVLGLLLGITGVLLVVVPSGSLPDSHMVGWALLALVSPACFAALNVFVDKFSPPKASVISLSVGICSASALMLLPFMIWNDQIWAPFAAEGKGGWAVVAAILINTLVWPLFYGTIRITGAFLWSMMNIIAVIFGFFWGWLFFGEAPSFWVWAAAALMMSSFLIIIIQGRQK